MSCWPNRWSASAPALRRCGWWSGSARSAAPRTISLISIHEHDIPDRFPQAALDQAEAARPVPLGDRTDLRDLPLVTIDGDDARDFDDAVWAAPDSRPARIQGGHRLVVAIADVAHYVTRRRCAGPRGAQARQLGLFPRPRRADAAGGAVQRTLLAEAEAGARLPGGGDDHRPRRQQARTTASCAA